MRTKDSFADGDERPGRFPAAIVARLRRDVPLAILDVAVLVSAYVLPLVPSALRNGGYLGHPYWGHLPVFLLIATAVQLTVNSAMGLYEQMWRYASVEEARRVLLAVVIGYVVMLVAWLVLGASPFLPMSVMVFGPLLTLIGFGAIRFQSRLFALRRRAVMGTEARVLVVGAGDGGAMVLKDIVRNPSVGLEPVVIVDDDPSKVGRTLFGVRVRGTTKDIPRLVARLEIDQVLLAIPSAGRDVVRSVAALCEEASVTLRVLPSVHEVVKGRVAARDIRDLQIEDLLGREQVETDMEAVRRIVAGRRVLITGAGGSIGGEIARQVLALEPAALVLLDHDETHLHDLSTALDGAGVVSALADVRDQASMLSTFMAHQPHVVFHAAAHKHVPLLETHPEEAVRTNIVGTANVVDAAAIAGVERFVLISTDKAVHPVSVMGSSKWFAEQIVRSQQDGPGILCAVRFGNVLGSRGSVIPTFLRQIARGGPVTVTDPAMTRYFMSIEEAVRLVLQAAAMSEGGEVFTLDMGEPVNVLELALNVIRLSGHIPGRDIHVEIVGPRPGERLMETLAAPEEGLRPSAHPAISVSRPPQPDPIALRRALRELEGLIREARQDELIARLKATWQEQSVLTGGTL